MDLHANPDIISPTKPKSINSAPSPLLRATEKPVRAAHTACKDAHGGGCDSRAVAASVHGLRVSPLSQLNSSTVSPLRVCLVFALIRHCLRHALARTLKKYNRKKADLAKSYSRLKLDSSCGNRKCRNKRRWRSSSRNRVRCRKRGIQCRFARQATRHQTHAATCLRYASANAQQCCYSPDC